MFIKSKIVDIYNNNNNCNKAVNLFMCCMYLNVGIYVYINSSRIYRIAQFFGGAKLWRIATIRIFGGKNFGRCLALAVSSGCLAVWQMPSSFGREYFGDSCTVHQIRQYFPPPKNCTIW